MGVLGKWILFGVLAIGRYFWVSFKTELFCGLSKLSVLFGGGGWGAGGVVL